MKPGLGVLARDTQAIRVVVDSPDICLKDHWLSGCGTDHRREPPHTKVRKIRPCPSDHDRSAKVRGIHIQHDR